MTEYFKAFQDCGLKDDITIMDNIPESARNLLMCKLCKLIYSNTNSI